MKSFDMLTINEKMQSREDLLDIMWRAISYFPEGIWEEINYVGNVAVKQDLQIKSKQEVFGAFLFARLLRRIRAMRGMYRVEDLLLGVTHDPVVVVYHRFEVDRFRRIVSLVHDYVSSEVGVISLFDTKEDATMKVAAHGLGHNRGLGHHSEPVDLMYEGLLRGIDISIDGFCIDCQRKLVERKE